MSIANMGADVDPRIIKAHDVVYDKMYASWREVQSVRHIVQYDQQARIDIPWTIISFGGADDWWIADCSHTTVRRVTCPRNPGSTDQP